MKNIFFLVFLFAGLNPMAQTGKTELFDLISSIAPDAALTSPTLAWNTNAQVNKSVKWKSSAPKKMGNEWVKEGSPDFVVAGKPFTCVNEIEGENVSCKWKLLLTGKTGNGFSTYSFIANDFPISEAGKEIDILFKKNKTSFTLVRKCTEGASMWNQLYKVSIPGKQIMWMWAEYESLSATGAQYDNNKTSNVFSFTFYFDKKTADAYCR